MDLDKQLDRTRKITLVILALFMTGLIHNSQSPFVWGLIFGTVVSLINAQLLANRLKKMSGLSINQAILFMRIGYGMRLVLVIVSLMLAYRHPGILNLKATAIGLFVSPAVSTLSFGFFLLKENFSK